MFESFLRKFKPKAVWSHILRETASLPASLNTGLKKNLKESIDSLTAVY